MTPMSKSAQCKWKARAHMPRAAVITEHAQSVRVHLHHGGWGESRLSFKEDGSKGHTYCKSDATCRRETWSTSTQYDKDSNDH